MELDFAMTTGFAGSKGSNNEFVITGEGISYLDKNAYNFTLLIVPLNFPSG